MAVVDANTQKVNQVLQAFDRWRTGPRAPSPECFNNTVALMIEKLEALQEGDDSWEQVTDD